MYVYTYILVPSNAPVGGLTLIMSHANNAALSNELHSLSIVDFHNKKIPKSEFITT
jgi:hypothetical protein